MEEKKSIPYNINKVRTSPIFEYYYDIKVNNNELYNSEFLNNSEIQHFSKTILRINKDSNENINDNISKEKTHIQKNNNFKLKSEVEKKEESSDNKNNKKDILKQEDLIIINISNSSTILRINPVIYQNASYEFLANNLFILLKDQLGSKFLQEKLEIDTHNCLSHLFPALLPNIAELSKEQFANYFIQKLFYYLNEEEIEYILKILEPEFLEICIDKHGTRVIQTIMDYLVKEKTKNLFFEIIKPIFTKLILELNGTHIIYKFIQLFPEFLEYSNIIIINNIVSISTNKRGSIFLQNYLTSINRSNLKRKVIESLLNNCSILIIDPFGNYILQYLLSMHISYITLSIINLILNNISFYSKHRYANYVIEKILIHANYSQKQIVIKKLSSKEIITDLAFDQQGNFILLKALNFARDNDKKIIINTVDSLRSKLEELPQGKIFLQKINNFS